MTKEEIKQWFKDSLSYEVKPVTYALNKSEPIHPTGSVWVTLKLDGDEIINIYINPLIEDNL